LPNQQKQENGFMTEWTMVLFILKTGNIDENITHLKKTKILEIFIFLQEICTERRRILMHSGFKKYMQKCINQAIKGTVSHVSLNNNSTYDEK
jgi:hypothetical protein